MSRILSVAFVVCVAGALPGDDAEIKLATDMKSKNAKTRLAAIEAAGKLGESGKGLSRDLCECLLDTDPKCAKAALISLESVRPDLYKALVKIVLDPSEKAKIEGIEELAALGKEARPTTKILANGIRQHFIFPVPVGNPNAGPSIPASLYAALKRVQPDDEETMKLLETIASPGGVAGLVSKMTGKKPSPHPAHLEHRYAALDYLTDWAGTEQERRKSIVPLLKSGLDNEVTILASIKTLGNYGRLAKAHVGALRELKLSPAEAIRSAATRAVEQIEDDVDK